MYPTIFYILTQLDRMPLETALTVYNAPLIMPYFLVSLNNLRAGLSVLFLPSPNHFIPPPVCSDLAFTYSLVIRFLDPDNDTLCPLPSCMSSESSWAALPAVETYKLPEPPHLQVRA